VESRREMENILTRALRIEASRAAPLRPSVALNLETEPQAQETGRTYFCVVDRLSYQTLDSALAHVRIQHGLVSRSEDLVRARKAEGGL